MESVLDDRSCVEALLPRFLEGLNSYGTSHRDMPSQTVYTILLCEINSYDFAREDGDKSGDNKGRLKIDNILEQSTATNFLQHTSRCFRSSYNIILPNHLGFSGTSSLHR